VFVGVVSILWDLAGLLLALNRHSPFIAVAFGVLAALSAIVGWCIFTKGSRLIK